MTELLFRDYNANNMTVDEGIDIIANKNNNFYFVQVKTTRLKMDTKTATVSIQKKNFDKFMNQQMRYVVVVKHSKGMRFFVLSNSAIEQLKYYRALAVNEKTGKISVKIKFNNNLANPVFYDKAEFGASYYEGFTRFDL